MVWSENVRERVDGGVHDNPVDESQIFACCSHGDAARAPGMHLAADEDAITEILNVAQPFVYSLPQCSNVVR